MRACTRRSALQDSVRSLLLLPVRAQVDETGYSPVSGGRLQVIDLEDADWCVQG